MRTDDALNSFNNSVRELAAALGITVQAVYSWGAEVPPLRAYQIRDVLAQQGAQLGAAETVLAFPQLGAGETALKQEAA